MLRKILCFLAPTQKRRNPVAEVVFPAFECDGMFVSSADMAELQHHLTMGIYHRERIEAAAARCCEILGVDPREDCIERDWANQIAMHGTDPATVIFHLIGFRKDLSC